MSLYTDVLIYKVRLELSQRDVCVFLWHPYVYYIFYSEVVVFAFLLSSYRMLSVGRTSCIALSNRVRVNAASMCCRDYFILSRRFFNSFISVACHDGRIIGFEHFGLDSGACRVDDSSAFILDSNSAIRSFSDDQ